MALSLAKEIMVAYGHNDDELKNGEKEKHTGYKLVELTPLALDLNLAVYSYH
jgi:hypothetical protein